MENILRIYTDGACSGNPGPGGWAAVMLYGCAVKELAGGEAGTTNNRMELQAVIEGLGAIKKPCPVEVYSDSSYIVNAINQGWLAGWQQNGWKTSAKDPVKNRDQWEALIALNEKYNPTYIKVKGHSTDKWNNRADELAVLESKKFL